MLNTSTFRKSLIAFAMASASQLALAADKVNFQLDWLAGGDKAPIYVGLQQGYFAAENLDVSIATGRGSSDAITKIATGSADIGLSDIVALLAAKANQQVPVTAVYSVFSKAPYAFFSLKSANIKTVADVANKRMATSPFTSANLFLPYLLQTNGVDEASIKLVKAEPGALSPMLMTGNTDVVISWITDTVRYGAQATEAGKEIQVLPWHDAGLEFYATSVIASDRFLQQRPDVAHRFLRAFSKAVTYTWAHPDAAGQAVHDAVPEVDAQQAADTVRSIKGLVMNEVSDRDGLGGFAPERLATTWEWTARAQKLDRNSFNPETAVNRNFVPARQLSQLNPAQGE